MANLEFCDKHNMVAYLKKLSRSEGFQDIVDFLNGSHIRYALTKNPTIYVSLIKKFWQTATVKTVDNREQEITATFDGKEFTVTEASVRRHLQLANVDGISVLPTTKFFDQLSLISHGALDLGSQGCWLMLLTYFTLNAAIVKKLNAAKDDTRRVVILGFWMLMVVIGYYYYDNTASYLLKTANVLLCTAKEELKERLTCEPIPNVPNEAVYEEWDDRVERATTTATSLDAECQEAIRGSIAQTRSERVPTSPHDSPFPRVHTLGSDEGSMTLQELTVLCTTLSKKVESLEADLKQTKQVYGAAYTKLIMKGEDQPKDQLGVLSIAKFLADAAKINVHTYIRRRSVVSTRSGGISIAGASMPLYTAGMVQEQEQERLGHEVAVGLQEELDEEERQRMARVHEAAQSFTKEEWENIRARVEANEELYKRLQVEERNKYSEVNQAKMLQLKRYSFNELNELFKTTMKNVNTFVPMETKDKGRASELVTGSSQETIIDSAEVGSSKRVAEAELDHEGSKRQKTNEALGSVQEQLEEEEKELLQEELQQMMMVVPVE
ncbi:hypothetical protein Tco_1402686 [Tanacetum coccineum]